LEKVRFVMRRRQTDVVIALRDVLGQGDPPAVYREGRFVHVQIYDRSFTVLTEKAAD
jgi:hypothetical protein